MANHETEIISNQLYLLNQIPGSVKFGYKIKFYFSDSEKVFRKSKMVDQEIGKIRNL